MFDALANQAAEALLEPANPLKEGFIGPMKKAWETLEWNNGAWFRDKYGYAFREPSRGEVFSACAIGAAAYGSGKTGYQICNEIRRATGGNDEFLWKIVNASNAAGSKEAAIKAVSELDWPMPLE